MRKQSFEMEQKGKIDLCLIFFGPVWLCLTTTTISCPGFLPVAVFQIQHTDELEVFILLIQKPTNDEDYILSMSNLRAF